jgi:cytochrome c oxidase subunit 1
VTLLLTDRHFGTHFYDRPRRRPAAVAAPLLVLRHPEVYIMILPGFGIISEVLPVFARKPIFGYKAVAAATAVIASSAARVGASHVRHAEPDVRARVLHAGSFLIAVPTGVKIFNWVATLWRGTIEFKTAAVRVRLPRHVLIGGITGDLPGVFPVDWQLTDTYFVVAHLHYVLMGGAVFADLRGDLLLVPEDHRRLLSEGLGKLQLLAHARRLPRHVPDPALARARRHAAARLRVRGRRPPRALQPDLDDRLVHPRRSASCVTVVNVSAA